MNISFDRLGQFALTSPEKAYVSSTRGSTEVERTALFMAGVLDKVEEQLGRVIPNIVGKDIIQEER